MNIKSFSVSIALIVLVYFASSTKAQFANSQMEAYSFFQESILPILPENMQKMARSYVEEASDRSLEVAQANLLKGLFLKLLEWVAGILTDYYFD